MKGRLHLKGHERIDRRTLALCRHLVLYMEEQKDAEKQEKLATVLKNLSRWKKQDVHCDEYGIWEKTIQNGGWNEVKRLLLEKTDYGVQMRQVNPFVGILPENVVDKVYRRYRIRNNE